MKAKRIVTNWFKASLVGNVLIPRRGCTRVTRFVPKNENEETTEERCVLSDKRLMVNRGDRLILCGPTVDETQSATVVHIELDRYRERLHVALGYGGPIRSREVHVIRGGRAA